MGLCRVRKQSRKVTHLPYRSNRTPFDDRFEVSAATLASQVIDARRIAAREARQQSRR
jgi:hypothetical protein